MLLVTSDFVVIYENLIEKRRVNFNFTWKSKIIESDSLVKNSQCVCFKKV